MDRIIELDANLANKIAAGEVVERPASVVKELIENAIDAGSTQVQIAVKMAGLESISITDNGAGIPKDDVLIALKRHATSKIKTANDLFKIKTLGFRGEALPSIASVSQMTIETARQEEAAGSLVQVKGGQVTAHQSAMKRVGTKITVAQLFYNTPARLKYLKSEQAEFSHITDIVTREALAHPEIAFRLTHDDKAYTTTIGNGDLKTAISGIYGLATAKKMVAISAQDLDYQVSGYVSLPEVTRANRNYITVLVNGRYIKNYAINRAIIAGYGSKLMVGRFPIAVIDIKLDARLADVNVHPTKQEVRLSKERELTDLITQAIAQRFASETLIPRALDNLPHTSQTPTLQETEPRMAPQEAGNATRKLYYDASKQDFYVAHQVEESSTKPAVAEKPVLISQPDWLSESDELTPSQVVASPTTQETERLLAENLNQTFPELRYLSQLHATYLLCESPEGLYLVDQHAAQERIKYEYFRDQIGEVSYDQQVMLAPVIIDQLSAADFVLVEDKKAALALAGIYLEVYGDQAFILREHPVWMREDEIESSVYAMIDLLLASEDVTVKKYREDLAIMMACKSAIKANMYLSDESAKRLLADLAQCKNPYNCPHGRPSVVKFTSTDIQKMFRRIQQGHEGAKKWSI